MKNSYSFVLLVLFALPVFGQLVPTTEFENFPSSAFSPDPDPELLEFPPADILTNVQSVASGDWNNPYTWDCNCIPGAEEGVRILSGHQVTVSLSAQIYNMVIAEGGALQMTTSTYSTLKVFGDVEINGALIAETGKLEFVSNQPQYFWGNAQVGRLAVPGGSLELFGPLEVTETMNLTNSTLITNDLLILGNVDGEMAQIISVENSDIQGDVTFVQRFDWDEDGWIAVSTPAADATFADWNNELTTTGFSGADFPGMEPNILRYDETQADEASSLVAPADINEAIQPGTGYYVYGSEGSVEVRTTGVPVVGLHVLNMTYTDNGDPEFDGLNMVGNPYASGIDWDSNHWIRYGMDQALYGFDENSGQFSAYVDGLSIHGGSDIIAPGEAFFVRATESNCGLIAQEGVKTDLTSSPVNQAQDILRLQLLDMFGSSDEMLIRFNEAATEDFDPGMDAVKMLGQNVHNIYTQGSMNRMGINQIAKSPGMEVPVYIHAPAGGSFILTIPQAPMDNEGGCMIIEDLLTGEFIQVTSGQTYAFTTDAGSDAHRFSISVAEPLEVAMEHVSCNGAGDAFITVQGQGSGEFTYHWFNGEEPMLTYQIMDGASTISGLNAGTYSVVVDGGTFCDGMTAVVDIIDPEPIEITSTEITTLGCGDEYTGAIAILAEGGTGPLHYEWTGGQTSPVINDLAAGFYHVMISDMNDCQIQQTFEVAGAVEVTASFEVAQTVITMTDGEAHVDIMNLTEGADTFLWNMGDGTFYEDETPEHVYTAPGVYDIDLEASNADCFGMTSISIEVVEQVVSVEELEAFGNTHAWMNGEGIQIDFDLAAPEELIVNVYNQVGQLIASEAPAIRFNERLTIDVPFNVNWALVDIQNLNTENAERFKVVR